MAEASMSVGQDRFTCPICLDLLKDPVAIPCGHSYCMGCIKGYWDQDYQKGVCSCPQCRQTFTPRPILGRNPILAEIVEKLKKTELQAAPHAHCYTGTGDVECGVCTGRKHKAFKSCLVCLDSYCQTHFIRHEELFSGKRHKVIDATGQLQENICPHHDKLLEVYCCTDQICICLLCMMDEHNGHKTVSAAAGRTEKQRQLGEIQRNSQQRIQGREKELQELRKAVESLRHSAQAAVEDSERIFTELIRSIERRRSEVKELIRAQEKAELGRAEGFLEQLEQEIAELRRRDTELEQLPHREDHIYFLQSFQSLCAPPGSRDLPSITVNPHFSFMDVNKSVSDLKGRFDYFCQEEFEKMSEKVAQIQIISTPESKTREEFLQLAQIPIISTPVPKTREEFLQLAQIPIISTPVPKTREEFLQYSCQLTLDPNTVQKYLCLSEGKRTVIRSDKVQSYRDHPERFGVEQVLCRESVSGRCYWEAEWCGGGAYIAVSYKGISRKAVIGSWFGYNNQSWSLDCSPHSYWFRHNNNETKLPVPRSSRIGVYLDHRAGTLSFYSISDTMTLLHKIQTTFTQPLYPGFRICYKSKVRILQNDITPYNIN